MTFYNTKNLYGLQQSIATFKALKGTTRQILIARYWFLYDVNGDGAHIKKSVESIDSESILKLESQEFLVFENISYFTKYFVSFTWCPYRLQ